MREEGLTSPGFGTTVGTEKREEDVGVYIGHSSRITKMEILDTSVVREEWWR